MIIMYNGIPLSYVIIKMWLKMMLFSICLIVSDKYTLSHFYEISKYNAVDINKLKIIGSLI